MTTLCLIAIVFSVFVLFLALWCAPRHYVESDL